MMKTTIIFLCFLGVCVAEETTLTITRITPEFSPSPNETSGNPSADLTTHSPAIVSSTQATPAHETNQPPWNCSTLSTATTPWSNRFNENHLLLIAGGLILACTILLISTLLLACKVCQLSRRLKMLSGHSDLMIPAKFWMGNNESNADAKETTVLMSNLIQTRDEDGDGGNGPETEGKKEGKDACENGVEQIETGAKSEVVEETPAAAAEDASSPKEEGEKQGDKSTSEDTKDGE